MVTEKQSVIPISRRTIRGSRIERIPIRNLWHPLIAPVPRPEIQIRRPVVRQILGVAASRATGELANIAGRHGRVEGVAANDLVHVRRRCHAGVHERIDAVDDELRAAEAKHGWAADAAAWEAAAPKLRGSIG